MPSTFVTMGQAAARLRASAIDEGAMVFVIALISFAVSTPRAWRLKVRRTCSRNLLHWRYTP